MFHLNKEFNKWKTVLKAVFWDILSKPLWVCKYSILMGSIQDSYMSLSKHDWFQGSFIDQHLSKYIC